jgi:hypothetical protein
VRAGALWLLGVVALGAVSRVTYQRGRAERCALDGLRIEALYRVDLGRDGETVHSFCCVDCAAEWPEVHAGDTWTVRDEVTGGELDHTLAVFVASDVVVVPSRGAATHAFARWEDAQAHAAAYHGARIPDPLETPER